MGLSKQLILNYLSQIIPFGLKVYMVNLIGFSIFPSACSNRMIGYLPTSRQLKHKGYENYYSLKMITY